MSGADPAEAARIAAGVERHLPPALAGVFDARFTRSYALHDEFVGRLALHVVKKSGLAAALAEGGTVDELMARAGLSAAVGPVPIDWLLRHLAARGEVQAEAGPRGVRFWTAAALPALDPSALVEEQRRHDPACLPSYALAAASARDYPAFLRGEHSGEEALLHPDRLPLWVKYFSNDNALYAVNNRVGAAAVEDWLPPRRGVILELGGGQASGASAVLERLAAAGRLGAVEAYHFTEPTPAFLARGRRVLAERFAAAPPLRCGPLDMNQPFAGQGIAPCSVSLVYAVNTLHVAHDLAFTLSEIRHALAPGGQLVIAECVLPAPGSTIYPEFVFNMLATFRASQLHPVYRPNAGFLSVPHWRAAFAAAGFDNVRALPEIGPLLEHFPTFCVAALGATRAA